MPCATFHVVYWTSVIKVLVRWKFFFLLNDKYCEVIHIDVVKSLLLRANILFSSIKLWSRKKKFIAVAFLTSLGAWHCCCRLSFCCKYFSNYSILEITCKIRCLWKRSEYLWGIFLNISRLQDALRTAAEIFNIASLCYLDYSSPRITRLKKVTK